MESDTSTHTVRQLVTAGILDRPMDGNHGEIHPKTSDFVAAGIPFIMASDLENGRVILSSCAHISETQARSLRKGFAKAGDVLISHKATMGRTALVQELPVSFLVLTPQVTYYRVLDSSRLNNRYLKYYFDSPKFQELFATWGQKGSTRAYLGITSQLDLPIHVPPIAQQRLIARILGSLDDKIELNRRMNETLEAMARALFQSWFIDFDPVRVKADGRKLDGMNESTATLFPDSFEESELGPIPKGWRLAKLPELFEVNPYRALPKGETAPYLDMQAMPTNGHHPSDWTFRPFGSGMKFCNGDTLLARITPCLENGKTAFVDFLDSDSVGWGSTEYIVLHPKPPLPPQYAYYLARTEEFRAFAIQNMTGTSGRQRVPSTCFDGYTTVKPSNAVAEQFGSATSATMARIRSNAHESRTLASIRDALLPKLLSGKLRIKEAERFVEAAL